MMPQSPLIDAGLSIELDDIVSKLGLAPNPTEMNAPYAGSRRRSRSFNPDDCALVPRLSLVQDENGVLRWVYQPAVRGPSSRRARRAARREIYGKAVYEVDILDTPPNEVLKKIEQLDDILTPKRGLRRIVGGQLLREICDGTDDDGGSTLLLVHGTFSKSDMFITELSAIEGGKALLAAAEAKYERVLAFDHPTLSVSPWINALDLERALSNVTGKIDVICHSRGGLVVAWWLRNGRRNVGNVVFVGAPLQGTSLASPASLRSFLDYCANIATMTKIGLGVASSFLPFLAAAQGLSAIFGGVLHAAANTPLADAAVVIVPGLASQSRVGNNAEIDRLTRDRWPTMATCHAVMSNFEPSESEAFWKIWKHFQRPKEKLLNWAADTLFDAEPNDLVVNTQSMDRLYRAKGAGGPGLAGLVKIESVYDFHTSQVVHHTNYFRQPETIKFLSQTLKL